MSYSNDILSKKVRCMPHIGAALTLTTWLTIHLTKSIQERAAAKEKPATMALRDWDSSSLVTRVTVSAATADIFFILYPEILIWEQFLFY